MTGIKNPILQHKCKIFFLDTSFSIKSEVFIFEKNKRNVSIGWPVPESF